MDSMGIDGVGWGTHTPLMGWGGAHPIDGIT